MSVDISAATDSQLADFFNDGSPQECGSALIEIAKRLGIAGSNFTRLDHVDRLDNYLADNERSST